LRAVTIDVFKDDQDVLKELWGGGKEVLL